MQRPKCRLSSTPDGAGWLDRPETQAVFAALAARGFTARAVGGAVRNSLAGRPVADVDIATDARPEEVIARGRGGGPQGHADRPGARHRHGGGRRASLRDHHAAQGRGDARPPRHGGLHGRLGRGRQAARFHPQRPLLRRRRHDLRPARRLPGSGGAPRALHRRRRASASARTTCASCASSASPPTSPRGRPMPRASPPACASAPASPSCRRSGCGWSCCACWRRRAGRRSRP